MPANPADRWKCKRVRRAFPDDNTAVIHAPEASNVDSFHHMHI
jgi:hypothetical protein